MAIHRDGNALVCIGSFVASGSAATGLTVSVDVYELVLASGTPTLVVNGGSATEMARGTYYYRLASASVTSAALYVFIFYTSGTADQKVVTQGWTAGMAWTENLDAAVTSRLAPTVAARTLDVSTGGEAGVDWANVGSPTTSNNLSGTTVSAVSGAVGSVTGSVASVAGNVGGNVVGSVASVAGAVGSVTGNVGGNVVGSVASVSGAVTVGTNNDKTGYALSSAGVQAIWDALSSALTTVGSVGKRIVDYLTGDSYTRLGAPSGASIAADIAAISSGSTPADIAEAVVDAITPATIVIRSPLALDGSLELVKGDSYLTADGRQIDFSVGSKNWPSDLTGGTVTLTVDKPDGTTLLTDTLSIVTATGSTRKVRWSASATTTNVATGSYTYEVRWVNGSSVARLEIGTIRIRQGTT